MKVVISGQIESIRTRVDGSIKFDFGCQELDNSVAGQLLQLRSKYVKCLISDTNITEMEASIIDEQSLTNEIKAKKPSQRLRAVLYRTWEQSKSDVPFDSFYAEKMEVLINHFKDKLD